MFRQLALLAALLVALAPSGPARAAQTAVEIPIPSPGVGDVGEIDTDGAWVAWSMMVQPNRFTRYVSLYAARLPDGPAQLIADQLSFYDYTGPHSPGFALDGGRLLFVERRQLGERAPALVLVDLAGGQRRAIAGAASLPSLAGDTAAWWEFSGANPVTGRLHRLNIADPADTPRVLAEVATPADYLLRSSQLGSSHVAWMQGWNSRGESDPPCWQVFGAPLAGGGPVQLADAGCQVSGSLAPPTIALAGEDLAYTSGAGELVVRPIAGGPQLVSGPHRNSTLEWSDGLLFWVTAEPYGVWGYDPVSDSAFPISERAAGADAGAGGGVVAWVGPVSAGGGLAIHARSVRSVTPTAPRPAQSAGGGSYFPETGHSMRGAFEAYWRRNGGLAVFGYPLTEEFVQGAPDTDLGFTVQYLERQRFEYHPENAGTPYDVLLGRLGAEALAAQGRDWQALPKADPATPHYVAATGQAIAPEFWGYWRTHGLDLGDPGLSEREALALWGYPITPAAIETLPDGSRLLVQWFERARFEYHPQNPEPYRVLLGRLAADRVNAFTWPR